VSREKLLTPEDVAAWMGVSPEWVQTMARNKEMPAVRLGRFWRFKESELEEWLQHRRTGPDHRCTATKGVNGAK
jgi:excisionase family DNA binding protein